MFYRESSVRGHFQPRRGGGGQLSQCGACQNTHRGLQKVTAGRYQPCARGLGSHWRWPYVSIYKYIWSLTAGRSYRVYVAQTLSSLLLPHIQLLIPLLSKLFLTASFSMPLKWITPPSSICQVRTISFYYSDLQVLHQDEIHNIVLGI